VISTGVHNPVALLFEFPEYFSKCFDIFRNPHDGGLKRLRVDVGECVSPVFVVRKLVTNRADTLFDGALVFGGLGEAIQGVVVELATGIAVVIQRFTLAFGRLEAIPVVVVHARWSSTHSFNTSSETCPVEMRQYELFQKESPHRSVLSSSSYSLRMRRAVAHLTVLINFTRSVVGSARNRM